MKKIDVRQSIGLLANLGVLVGILLLVYELNQNRDMMRAQIRNEIATSLSGVLNAPTNDAELVDLMYRSDNGEEVSGPEDYRLGMQSELLFRYWENVHYQYRQGLYDDSEFSGHSGAIGATLNSRQRLVRFWCRDRTYYSRPFIQFIDGLLSQAACDPE